MLGHELQAQEYEKDTSKVTLVWADLLESGLVDNKPVMWVRGNARFEHKGIKLRCDSAFQFDNTNIIHAFGHIRIRQGDTLTLTGDRLIYNGDSSHANINGKVRLKEKKMTLTSDELDYYIKEGRIEYNDGGRIRDEENTLTSMIGVYQVEERTYTFKDSVILIRDSSKVLTDTLEYLVDSNVAVLRGPTVITSEDKRIDASFGKFYTETEQSFLSNKARVETQDYILEGDSLFYDSKLDQGYAQGNIYSFSKEDSVVITGHRANRWGDIYTTKVRQNANLLKIQDGDTVFIKGDTLISVNDSVRNENLITAYGKVKVFKTEFQGICDSLIYSTSDSTITFYDDPVVWTDNNQIIGDTLHILLSSGEIDKALVRSGAFIISEDTIGNYNQVKGRNMTAYFVKSEIDHVDVDGNGQSIYFALDDDNKLMGMNFVECSNMIIKFIESRLHDISFLTSPTATFVPPHEILSSATGDQLPDFMWRISERPLKNWFYPFSKE